MCYDDVLYKFTFYLLTYWLDGLELYRSVSPATRLLAAAVATLPSVGMLCSAWIVTTVLLMIFCTVRKLKMWFTFLYLAMFLRFISYEWGWFAMGMYHDQRQSFPTAWLVHAIKCLSAYYAALLPRRGPHIASHSLCPSVCLSVRPVIVASRRAT